MAQLRITMPDELPASITRADRYKNSWVERGWQNWDAALAQAKLDLQLNQNSIEAEQEYRKTLLRAISDINSGIAATDKQIASVRSQQIRELADITSLQYREEQDAAAQQQRLETGKSEDIYKEAGKTARTQLMAQAQVATGTTSRIETVGENMDRAIRDVRDSTELQGASAADKLPVAIRLFNERIEKDQAISVADLSQKRRGKRDLALLLGFDLTDPNALAKLDPKDRADIQVAVNDANAEKGAASAKGSVILQNAGVTASGKNPNTTYSVAGRAPVGQVPDATGARGPVANPKVVSDIQARIQAANDFEAEAAALAADAGISIETAREDLLEDQDSRWRGRGEEIEEGTAFIASGRTPEAIATQLDNSLYGKEFARLEATRGSQDEQLKAYLAKEKAVDERLQALGATAEERADLIGRAREIYAEKFPGFVFKPKANKVTAADVAADPKKRAAVLASQIQTWQTEMAVADPKKPNKKAEAASASYREFTSRPVYGVVADMFKQPLSDTYTTSSIAKELQKTYSGDDLINAMAAFAVLKPKKSQ
jgi:hypothetical protein